MLEIIEKDLKNLNNVYEKDDRLRGAVQEGYQGRRLLGQVHLYTDTVLTLTKRAAILHRETHGWRDGR